ncbi:substrate-binding domain-containing protein [Tessaracoccus sp. MC1627]|nr:substrate-binding domain-containing protein [Tessaracoccus sp. MC1627]
MLLAALGNAYHTDVVIGVEDAAAEQGMGVLISHGRGDSERMAAQLGRLVQLGVEGVVIVSAHTPPGALAEAARVMPAVVVGRPAMLPESVSGISNDDELGGRLAVTHLADGGRSRVGFLQMSGSPSAVARRDAYLRVVAERGLPATVLSPEGLDAETLRGVDAVFASNDRGAVQVLAVAHDAGVSVPTELAVVGYDDTDLARLVRPQLSSIAQRRLEMGRRALEILQGREVVRETHAPHLVVRASSAPA